MDLSINWPVKQFQLWYAEQIHQQLAQECSDGEFEPLNLRMQIIMENGSKLLVEICKYVPFVTTYSL